MKKKICIFIILIIFIASSIFIVNLYRKHVIVAKIREKLDEYRTITNYSIKNIGGGGTLSEYYQKDINNYCIKGLGLHADNLKAVRTYYKNGTANMYITSYDDRSAVLDIEGYDKKPEVNENCFEDYLKRDNFLEYLKLLCKIKIEECNYKNKEMYRIDNLDKLPEYFTVLGEESYSIYVEKDTGLINEVVNTGLYDVEFEFNNVTDSMLEEPDLELYKTATVYEN